MRLPAANADGRCDLRWGGKPGTVQQAVRQHADIRKLRFLLYPGNLTPDDLGWTKADDEDVIWLGQ